MIEEIRESKHVQQQLVLRCLKIARFAAGLHTASFPSVSAFNIKMSNVSRKTRYQLPGGGSVPTS